MAQRMHGLCPTMWLLSNARNEIVGRCISMALSYGGTAPHFFSKSVAAYLCDQPLTTDSLSDIPDQGLRGKVEKVGHKFHVLTIAT